jgi:hypothetical protein
MDITGCSLAELVDDPLIGLAIKSDGVGRCELELTLELVARERLRAVRPADPRPWRLTTKTAPCSRC